MTVEENLQKLGLHLPSPPRPVANYVPTVQVDRFLFTSGILPISEGKVAFPGKVGREVSLEDGQEASRLAVLNALALIKQALGTLERVARVVKLTGYISSGEGFTQQPAVLNSASDLIVSLFGDRGRHSRVAIGAFELPLGSPVEIELLIEIKS